MAASEGNLAFTPRPVQAVALRPDGAHMRIAQPVTQRLAALRAYAAFSSGRDWMEKLSSAYVVALGTRSADTYLMRRIQQAIPEVPAFTCRRCREATIGINTIRRKLFPTLHALRERANDLIHHLDDPENRGIADLNVKGVFDYCYHLFEEHADLLFGNCPDGTFEFKACRDHRGQSAGAVKYDAA